MKWLKELNPSFQHDSQNLSLQHDSSKLNPSFQQYSKNWTHFFWIWLKELNLGSKKKHKKKWNSFSNMTQKNRTLFFCNLTQRIEFFSIWLKELSFLKNYSKNSSFLFSNMTLRIELFFQYDSKNWTLLIFQFVSINWTMDPNMLWR